MIPPEKRDHVMKLHAQGNGKGIRWIARSLKISRNTVREILGKKARKPVPEAEIAARESRLDPYKKDVEEILRKDEEIRRMNRSARSITATGIFKKIRKLGYPGGRTAVDEYVRELRGPTKPLRPHARFETAVAEESQMDWSTYRVEIAGKVTVIQVFSLILCWSRQQFLKAYLDQKRHTLLWGHVAAFRYFEGVPWKIVYDQQRTIVTCLIEGKPVFAEEFERFSKHYGFEPWICRPRHKERKGKIEKPFDYFEGSFLPHRTFKSLEGSVPSGNPGGASPTIFPFSTRTFRFSMDFILSCPGLGSNGATARSRVQNGPRA